MIKDTFISRRMAWCCVGAGVLLLLLAMTLLTTDQRPIRVLAVVGIILIAIGFNRLRYS